MIFLVIVRRAQCEICEKQFDLKYGESPPDNCPLCNSPDWLYGTESRDGRFIRQGINRSSKILNPGVRSKKQHDFTKNQYQAFKPKPEENDGNKHRS